MYTTKKKRKQIVFGIFEDIRRTTFTPLVTPIDGVFAPQLNTFAKLLAERLGKEFDVKYGMIANFTRIRIEMSIFRAESMCIRGTEKIKILRKPFRFQLLFKDVFTFYLYTYIYLIVLSIVIKMF